MNREEILNYARKLRLNPTPAEEKLWKHLRNRMLKGKKFKRQHIIKYAHSYTEQYFFIVDFFCAERELIVELDGKIHDFQKKKDETRESILDELGYKVKRFKNEEVMDNIFYVLSEIALELE